MSPPPRAPPIPLAMAGGRPMPGNLLRRPGTPTRWELALAPANVRTVAGANVPRASDFAVGSEVTPGTVAPPPSLAGSGEEDGVAGVASAVVPRPAVPAPARARLPARAGASGLYGQPIGRGRNRPQFAATPRLEDWLDRLQSLTLARQENEEVPAAAAASGSEEDKAASDGSENSRAGDKRKTPSDDDEERDLEQPASKRSRVGAAIQRTFSRMSRNRADSAASNHPPASLATSASPSLSAAAAATAANPSAADSAALASAPRAFSPSSLFSRVASPTTATAAAGPPSSVGALRTIRVCLVGDVGAGKSAFFNRLVNDTFALTSPTLAPDCKTVPFRTSDGELVKVELWDFPGIVAGARGGPLLSTFFHGAIICFNLENKRNLKSISEVWKPKLNASLHEQAVFVLGLKRDLRPTFPSLGLSFLPTIEPATCEEGQKAATTIGADGYGECSARTKDNVEAAWGGIINHIVARVADQEHSLRHPGKRERAKKAVAGFLNKCGIGRHK